MGLGVWGSEVFGGGSAVLGVISDELGPSAAWRKLTSGLASDLPIFLPPCLPPCLPATRCAASTTPTPLSFTPTLPLYSPHPVLPRPPVLPLYCSEMFSVNHFIVSQTNPHIVPFLNLKRRMGTAGAVAESEFKHRWACCWCGRVGG